MFPVSMTLATLLSLGAAGFTGCSERKLNFTESTPGLAYCNDLWPRKPWSVHIARVDWHNTNYAMAATHAAGTVMGLNVLSEQVLEVPPELGVTVAAVNGDFYARETSVYPGDPRGLQIMFGDLVSGPSTGDGGTNGYGFKNGACFWIAPAGEPRGGPVESGFKAQFPDGSTVAIGLNELRRTNLVVLFTPTLGSVTTRTTNGLEFVLEHTGQGSWLPLKAGASLTGRVSEVVEGGSAPIETNTMVLSMGPELADRFRSVSTGAVVRLSLATTPDLSGSPAAIGGGPILVKEGRVVKQKQPSGKTIPYEIRSMFERHPRAAVGWNAQYIFLVLVDGRQKNLSMGMTLAELAKYMQGLGCTGAMNLDGGGSATLWYEGKVRNNPCEKEERPTANALAILRKGGK